MHRFEKSLFWRIAAAVLASAFLAAGTGGLPAVEDSQPEPLNQRIARLIEQLGDPDYSVRQRAQDVLAEIGFEAYDALTAAAHHDDLEIAARARYLLRLIPAQWTAENDPPEVQKYLELYPQRPPEVRIQVMQLLGRVSGGAGIPALCRLVRFEQDLALSKRAAIEVLRQEPPDETGRARFEKAVRKYLTHSQRPGARWLLASLEFHKDNPENALAEWSKLVDAERAALARAPNQSSPSIVAALVYHLAMARADRGQRELAEKTATEARQIEPGNTPVALYARLDTANTLQRRGMFSWAELEYRRVIEADSSRLTVTAHVALSEMWHDQGKDLSAAEVLEDLIRLIEEKKLGDRGAASRSPGEIRSRMSYFLACHWLQQGDAAKHRRYLDEAIEADPAELDALIARCRLPNPEPEYHRKTLELVEEAAADLRDAIHEAPENPTYYNQFAWLVGNTEGDLDEALKYSKRSLELSPGSGAYLDTLAHVYFRRGDYENAVKTQARAAELEPHSGLITKKLEVFREALAKSKKPETQPAGQPEAREDPVTPNGNPTE